MTSESSPVMPTQPGSGSPLDAPELLGTSRAIRSTAEFFLRRFSWFIVFLIMDVVVIYGIMTNPVLIDAWNFIIPGIGITLVMTVSAFVLAIVIGLITAFGRISNNPVVYNATTLYVELFRGLP